MSDPKNLIYLPPRAASVTLQSVEKRMQYKSNLVWNIPEIDARFNPGNPGDVMTLLARPGMCKTTTAMYLARTWTRLCRQHQNPNTTRPPLIVFFTLEVLVNDFMISFVAGDSGQSIQDVGRGIADIGRIRSGLVANLGNNLCIVGHSDEDYNVENIATDNFFPSIMDLNYVLQELVRQGYSIAAVFIDYLQYLGDIDNKPVDDRQTAVVTRNLQYCKAFAARYKTCFVINAQAARKVDGYAGFKFPLQDDCQWSSAIEQTTDKLFSLTMPSKYMPLGKQVACNGLYYAVTPTLLAIKKLKERGGTCDDSDVYMVDVNLATAEFMPAIAIGEVRDEQDTF